MGFLDFLGTANKNIIGINISHRSEVEIMVFDAKEKRVLKYDYEQVDYNISSRKLVDYTALCEVVRDLFDSLGLNLKSDVIVSMPTILLGHQTLPSILDDDATKLALVSETERNYIFKKNEPIISWSEVSYDPETEDKLVSYSAIQEEELDRLLECFRDMGMNVVAVETSFASFLKGLQMAGIIDEQIDQEKRWAILMVNLNSVVVMSMNGNNLMDLVEEPLAIKSFNEDEIYPTLKTVAMNSLSSLDLDDLLVVSESDDVSAEILASQINLNAKTSFLECNKFTKEQLIPCDLTVLPNKINNITPEAIGTASYYTSKMPLKFNFLKGSSAKNAADSFVELNLFGRTIHLTPQLFQYLILAVAVGTMAIMGAVGLLVQGMNGAKEKEYSDLEMQIAQLKEKNNKQSNQNNAAAISDTIKKVDQTNKDKIKSIEAINIDIPKNLWLDFLEIHDDGSCYIIGKSYSIGSIISFYKSLEIVGRFKDLKLTSITSSYDFLNAKTTNGSSSTPANASPPAPAASQGSSTAPSTQPTNGAGVSTDTAAAIATLNSLSIQTSLPSSKYYVFVFGQPKQANKAADAGAAAPGGSSPAPSSPAAVGGPSAPGGPGGAPMGPH